MTAALEAAPAVASGVLLALAAGLVVLLAWASRGGGQPAWQPGELAALNVVQSGRHRPAAGTVDQLIADDHGHIPRHGWAEVPPSIASALERLTPTERARELVRQLGQARYSPWRGTSDRRMLVRLQAATIARRHGIPLVLGTFGARPVWP